jgi:2'-5' RNA ligase
VEIVGKKHAAGTYVGLRVLEPSASQIYQKCAEMGVKPRKSDKERRLHCTVLYSKVPCPKIQADLTVHEARAISYSIFNNSRGEPTVLVVRLNAPSVYARHLELMADHGASYDYPTYEPHVTLAHSFTGDPLLLPMMDFPIMLGEEYVQELQE